MVWWEAVLLFVGGGVAGIVNAMAGGGSSLTVPLLVLAGVPGNFANGTNRVGIFVSNGTTIWSFHRQGVKAYKEALPFFLTLAVTMTALPIFIVQGKVRWLPAFILTVGLSVGGWLGARIAVKGGERIIRIFMIIAAIGLTGRLVGLYG